MDIFPLREYDDILHMPQLSVDIFLDNIQIRYQNGIYYTNIGEVCVSVNPNKTKLSIYGPDYIEMYHSPSIYRLPPHIFAIANSAYRRIFEQNSDCSIIITGESGSGKTEASKIILMYIDYVNHKIRKDSHIRGGVGGRSENDKPGKFLNVENLLIKSNCILESFGNAQTICNNNSSRFGKYTEISFVRENSNIKFTCSKRIDSDKYRYSYGMINNYLLEKCRVIEQQEGERNFHAFYQLLSVLNSEKFAHLFQDFGLVDNVEKYHYLNNSSKIIEQDRYNFKQVHESMLEVGFPEAEIKAIFKVLASILVLGNIKFDLPDDFDGEVSNYEQYICVESFEYLTTFCRLLSMDEKFTMKTLCSRVIRTPLERIHKLNDNFAAIHGRDALAKTVYQRLFAYILNRINQFLKKNKPKFDEDEDCLRANTIGILDIYGFEVFNNHSNGFEQFLINYCNEKLHQLFIDQILRKEQNLYEEQDINWEMIDFADNISICHLIDGTHQGIFSIINDACLSSKAYEDEELLKCFAARFADNQYFTCRVLDPSLKELDPEKDFIIRHFAGDVRYSVEKFIEKNLDQLYYDYLELLKTSPDPLIKEIIEKPEDRTIVNKKPVTASFQFCKSLEQLLSKLKNQQQLYIRCIKPTDKLDSKTNRFDRDKVRHQIQYLGLIENAKIRKAGFWCQYRYEIFIRRFSMLLDRFDNNATEEFDTSGDSRSHYQPICLKILKKLPMVIENLDEEQNNRFAFGRTIIFLRDPEILKSLERERLKFLEKLVLVLQTYGRKKISRNLFQRLKLANSIFTVMFKLEKLNTIQKKVEEYEKRFAIYKSSFLDKPIQCLEYNDFKHLTFSLDFSDEILFRKDDLYSKIIPDLTFHLNRWLIIIKFPFSYWNEKSLRIEAAKIFLDRKEEWGYSRSRWLGDYLVYSSEINQQLFGMADFFRQNSEYFGTILFSSCVYNIDSRFIGKISAMIMNKDVIYNINIKTKAFRKWINIRDIESVSLTPGRDQLVVLHQRCHSNEDDLVFSFCRLKSNVPISCTRMAFEKTDPLCETRVGEFVTLLKQQYELLTKLPLRISFSREIAFNFQERFDCYIRAMESNSEDLNKLFDSIQENSDTYDVSFWCWNTTSFSDFFRSRMSSLYRMLIREPRQDQDKKRLAKLVEFRKLSENELVLVFE